MNDMLWEPNRQDISSFTCPIFYAITGRVNSLETREKSFNDLNDLKVGA
jgi:hypothetical protein